MSKKVTNPETASTPKVKKVKAPAVLSNKRLAELEKMEGDLEEGEEDEVQGKIKNILKLHIKGWSNKEIILAGYNKSTVYRQVGEFKKLQKAPALQYMGYKIYEARIQDTMKRKGLSRAKAVEFLANIDLK